ncbi:hypothetical protein FN846DRAFT_1021555 [Sphaerosporella brunnea]|uniref:Uncharacterized protein n=1 Tax=Sphaerosporella brunnea TaxID=1250544 RepID=A0A5J5EXH7_9PEZI|nr:hypothetical protein FN846DRAFT_1021555 [Sphaerosporella brunnea]
MAGARACKFLHQIRTGTASTAFLSGRSFGARNGLGLAGGHKLWGERRGPGALVEFFRCNSNASPSKYPNTPQKTKGTTSKPTSSASNSNPTGKERKPLDDFFARFPNFTYNRDSEASSEFSRLCVLLTQPILTRFQALKGDKAQETEFFKGYSDSGFDYDPKKSAEESLGLLCRFHTRKERYAFLVAFREVFIERFGGGGAGREGKKKEGEKQEGKKKEGKKKEGKEEEVEKKDGMERLCTAIECSLEELKSRVIHVNIYDVEHRDKQLSNGLSPPSVQRFKTVEQLAAYSFPHKVYPQHMAKGRAMEHILRHLLDPENVGKSRK